MANGPQRPRVAPQPKAAGITAFGSGGIPARHGLGSGLTPASVAAGATGSHNALGVFQPAPPAPPPAPAGPPAAADPRDSQYGDDVTRLVADNKNAQDDLTQQGQYDTQDHALQGERLARQRAASLVSTNQGANQEGLFYSGQLGKRRGQVEQGFNDQVFDANTAFERAAAARAQQSQRLGSFTPDSSSPLGVTATGGAGLDLTAAYNAAVRRRLSADQSRAV